MTCYACLLFPALTYEHGDDLHGSKGEHWGNPQIRHIETGTIRTVLYTTTKEMIWPVAPLIYGHEVEVPPGSLILKPLDGSSMGEFRNMLNKRKFLAAWEPV